ncbi:MAG: hypothetical protein JNN20_00760 [Betaproteobacteria bacterium]|nr:hypothetical protein [Betaproteobacteria bacterium]
MSDASARAADCMPVRPPGLVEEELDLLLLSTIGKFAEVRQTPEILDVPIDIFRHKRNEFRDSLLLDEINAALGVDVDAAIHSEAKKVGIKKPLQEFSLRRVIEIAKEAYRAAPNTELSPAPAGKVFDATIFTLAVPNSPGWVMFRCAPDHIIVRLERADSEVVETASAKSMILPPFTTAKNFVALIPEGSNILSEFGLNASSGKPRFIENAGAPCIETTVEADVPWEVDGKEVPGGKHIAGFLRTCYASRYKEKAYAHQAVAIFYVSLGETLKNILAKGNAFANNVKLKSASSLNGPQTARRTKGEPKKSQ